MLSTDLHDLMYEAPYPTGGDGRESNPLCRILVAEESLPKVLQDFPFNACEPYVGELSQLV